ncbi:MULTISPECIES: hypothetical protein [Chryseobacterium]|uniref:Uncharacterized protein n=1 Tax=Chryseobacterium balustinum TaxID=246 RepID=A0AAX2IP29_9FLAO|nr:MULTISPECIES: hypothetical protein [Chryseobacterium]AZB29271.1 hypothetical protein EB354_08390 [Chryseobacterium balustinum]MDY0931165.1 hypothetical protein [Chryseobacterium sp. CFBP8996]SKB70458.1 hypothetical protein SAMN05421800_106164 [Chryseobacterium balustinum]SQA91458.1 Uncharacterised protein [Chryseobacterium balustinum]
MKKIVLISLLLVINSCHSQDKEKKNDNNEGKSSNIKIEIPINPKTMQTYTSEKFNIENYYKHSDKISRTYEYEMSNGTKVTETDFDDGFYATYEYTNSFFITHKEFFKNGLLKSKWQTFLDDGFIKGDKYEYGSKGKLIKVEDWDKPFTFTWEQVKKYVEQDLKLDILKDKVGIDNDLEYPDYNFPTWNISYIGKYKDNPRGGIIRIMLNGINGEVLLVERQLGKGGEGTTVETLYKKESK